MSDEKCKLLNFRQSDKSTASIKSFFGNYKIAHDFITCF